MPLPAAVANAITDPARRAKASTRFFEQSSAGAHAATPARSRNLTGRIIRGRAVVSPRGRRDHLPDRRRSRGRPRGVATRAVALTSDPRDRRGDGRRVRRRAHGEAQARRGDHGPAHAGHGRTRGNGARPPESARTRASSSSPRTASARFCSVGSNRVRADTSSRRRRTRRFCARSRRSQPARPSSTPDSWPSSCRTRPGRHPHPP